MPEPSLTPTTLGAGPYRAAATKGAIANLRLSLTLSNSREITVSYPSAAADVQVRIARGAPGAAAAGGRDLLPDASATGGLTDTTTVPNREIQAATAPGGAPGTTTLSVTVRATSAPASNEEWEIRISSSTPRDYDIATTGTFARVMCDPVARFTLPGFPPLPAGHAPEGAVVSLTAPVPTAATTTPVTVVGLPLPATQYRWQKTGPVAIPAFGACAASPTFSFTTPAVYAAVTIEITLEVWYDGTCPSTRGLLWTQTATQSLTIDTRAQQLMVVLDRSGSMSGARWENAETATRILVQLFAALRAGVNEGDRIGVLAFEDNQCRFHPAPIDAGIESELALTAPGTARTQICSSVDLGSPGACTPIGDALVRAQQLLGAGSTDGVGRTIVLLTDGYENSGTTRVDPGTPAGGSYTPPTFTPASDVRIFTVGLGETYSMEVMDRLASVTGSANVYRHVTDAAQDELKAAMAQAVSFAISARVVTPAGPARPDPSPPANARYFALTSGAERLAAAVEWTDPADTLDVAWREFGSTDAFMALAVTTNQCPTHGFVSQDVRALLPGGAPTGTEWRLVHRHGGANQVVPDANLLVFEDLHAQEDVTFDRDAYGTGDPMRITARLRFDDEPITDVRVFVELARPGESLGTFLAVNSGLYKSSRQRGPDPPAPKQAMLEALLSAHDMDGLGEERPPGMFADGSDELFDDGAHGDGDASDGNFANLYLDTQKEGPYTFRFRFEGFTPDGSPFNRTQTITKWVGVAVHPGFSPLSLGAMTTTATGLRAVTVTVRPGDAARNLLGPFRAHEIDFRTTAGAWAGDADDRLDGRYSRTLHYKQGEFPVVTVVVQGKPLLPVVIVRGGLRTACMRLRQLIEIWMRRTARSPVRQKPSLTDRARDLAGKMTRFVRGRGR